MTVGLAWALKFDTGEYLVMPHTAGLGDTEKVQDTASQPSQIVRVSFRELRKPTRRITPRGAQQRGAGGAD